MKTKLLIYLGFGMMLSSCVLEEIANDVITTGTGTGTGTTTAPALTNEEVIQGLKEALTIGIKKGAEMASMTDGFFKNDLIKIPFPPEANNIKDKAIEWGLQGKVDEIILTLNRAAELASQKATPIFVDAITNMSIGDGFEILHGSDSAATMYLIKTTTAPLTEAFLPVVKEAIETVELTKYWNPVATKYNQWAKISGKSEINPDLDKYVTDRGITGLFVLVKQEEKKIRKDPVAQVTDLLKKVFGSLL
ncbi:MAG: DUF4197 domain-containing protein [Crocinitomicaceae bacterium]|nr:DUF4197 domain-containing protein [Crocinitomicaceae bacterium]MBK8926062.1 DUF4197 domain-containing protein [Crocinitomicaceae bacterium]